MDFPEAYRIEQMLDHMHKEMKTMASDLSKLTASVQTLSGAVDMLLTMRAAELARIADLEGQLAAAQPAIDALQQQVDAETAKVQAVEPAKVQAVEPATAVTQDPAAPA